MIRGQFSKASADIARARLDRGMQVRNGQSRLGQALIEAEFALARKSPADAVSVALDAIGIPYPPSSARSVWPLLAVAAAVAADAGDVSALAEFSSHAATAADPFPPRSCVTRSSMPRPRGHAGRTRFRCGQR